MTKFQKFLVLFLLIGIGGLCYTFFTKPVQTPESTLVRFHTLVQKVLYDMKYAEQKSAQKTTQKALKLIQEGIVSFPDRLDLRLSEIHFCQMIGDTACMHAGIARTLEQAQVNRHDWQWHQNEKRGKNFMLDAFQKYQKNLWIAWEDEAFQKNAELILSFYPDNVMNLDNLGVLYLEKKDFEKAKEYLERAHLLNPDDPEVIAHLKKVPGGFVEPPKKKHAPSFPKGKKIKSKNHSHKK